jgi:AcrR family transcriptional regulator
MAGAVEGVLKGGDGFRAAHQAQHERSAELDGQKGEQQVVPESTHPYHHGDLRHALMAAALKDIQRDGPAALSLRALARQVGVSHAAPVHYFGDKAGLLTAIATEGYLKLADEQRRVVAYARPGHAAADRQSSTRDRAQPRGAGPRGWPRTVSSRARHLSGIRAVSIRPVQLARRHTL